MKCNAIACSRFSIFLEKAFDSTSRVGSSASELNASLSPSTPI
jgi:hypothetical protein